MVTRLIWSLHRTTLCVQFLPSTRHLNNMPKSKKQTSEKQKASTPGDTSISPVITDAKKKVLIIKVLAKPGAKQNHITDIGPEGVGIQIAAPPVDGEANTELISYLSKVLGLRKSEISLDRGSKSRNKTIMVHAAVAVEDVLSKLQSELDNG